MSLALTRNITDTFNAKLASTQTLDIAHSSQPKFAAQTLSHDSARKAPELQQNIERLEGAMGLDRKPNNGGMDIGSFSFGKVMVGAVGFLGAALGGPVGTAVAAGASFSEGATFIAKPASAQPEQPSQFLSAAMGSKSKGYTPAEMKETDDLLNGIYTDCMGGSCSAGWMLATPSNAGIGGSLFEPKQAPMGGKELKQAEKAHGAMVQQLAGLEETSGAAIRYGREEGVGGLANGVKAQGTVATGWTQPSGPTAWGMG